MSRRQLTRTLGGGLRALLCTWVMVLAVAGCTTPPGTRGPASGAGGSGKAPGERTADPVRLTERERQNLRVFDRAWDLVNRRFFDEKFRGVDWAAQREKFRPQAQEAADDEALYTTINAMLRELKESHNYALKPQQVMERKAQQRAAVGFRMRRVEDRWVITEVRPGSPAEEAGVRNGWLVAKRDGVVVGESPRFESKDGQAVVYEFIDPQEQTRTLTMVARNLSTVDATEKRVFAGGVVYLRFDGFDRASRRWLSEQLKANRAAPGVVLDLRENRGGYLFSLGITVGEFFAESKPIGTMIARSGATDQEESWSWLSARYPGKLVVLIDNNSASCAEILAHVLKRYGRAKLVGRKTAGAVVVSRVYSLPGGGELQVGVADYLGLDGRRLEGDGVTPDISATLTLAALREGRDPDVEAALELMGKP